MDTPLHIIICHNFSDFSYADSSMQLAIKLANDGHDVIFFSHALPANQPTIQGLTIKSWPEKRPTGFASFLALFKAIKKQQTQVLIAHAAALNMAGLAARFAAVPLRIGYYHSAYEATLIDNKDSQLIIKMKRFRKKLFYTCFHKMICVSSYAQTNLHSWFQYPLAQTVVIPNALADRLHGGQILPKPAVEPLQFFSAGRLDPGKNTLDMAKGFIAFSDKYPGKAKLLIAGIGPLASNISALSADHPCVQYLGQLPYAQIDSFIEKSHIVVCSTLAEAFGMTIIEAMMLATPVLVSAVGGPAEIVENGQTGWLVNGSTPEVWQHFFETTYLFILQRPAAYEAMRKLARLQFLTHYQQSQQLFALEKAIRPGA